MASRMPYSTCFRSSNDRPRRVASISRGFLEAAHLSREGRLDAVRGLFDRIQAIGEEVRRASARTRAACVDEGVISAAAAYHTEPGLDASEDSKARGVGPAD